jgi:hypothetical protein
VQIKLDDNKIGAFAMFTRMAIGLLVGALAAAMLEFINVCFTFMLPPLIIITPLCFTISLIVAGRTKP